MAQQDQQPSRGEIIARAQEANNLLNGPIFSTAFDHARSLFIREWDDAETVQIREVCWAKVQGLKEVQRQLRRIISKGKHASRQPDER